MNGDAADDMNPFNMSRGIPVFSRITVCNCLIAFVISPCVGCGTYPTIVSTPREVAKADSHVTELRIPGLAVTNYSLLSKFSNVRQVQYHTPEGDGATDEKLRALAALNFTNLQDIGLLNCPLVTDQGIRALASIKSLKMLQLEGTSIGDGALEVISSQMQLSSVNVANCNVTSKGLHTLAASDTIKLVGFSVNRLSQDDILGLVDEFRNVTYCLIVDPERMLNEETVKARGKNRGIRIVITQKGALQNLLDYQRAH